MSTVHNSHPIRMKLGRTV